MALTADKFGTDCTNHAILVPFTPFMHLLSSQELYQQSFSLPHDLNGPSTLTTSYLQQLAIYRPWTQLCKSPSRSVYPLIRLSIGWSIMLLKLLSKSYLNRITAPAHLYATDAVVSTALF